MISYIIRFKKQRTFVYSRIIFQIKSNFSLYLIIKWDFYIIPNYRITRLIPHATDGLKK